MKKIRIDAGKRAVRFEEKAKENGINKIFNECWKEIESKREKDKTRWDKTREEYYEKIKRKIDMRKIEAQRREGRSWERDFIIAGKEKQRREIQKRITGSRYNSRYMEIREESRPDYLKASYKRRDQS